MLLNIGIKKLPIIIHKTKRIKYLFAALFAASLTMLLNIGIKKLPIIIHKAKRIKYLFAASL